MKKKLLFVLYYALGLAIPIYAQESNGNFSVNTNIVSNYIWRGTKFGNGPAIQPGLEFSSGNFKLGAWGSYCISDVEAAEADIYSSFSFGNLSLGLTGYYFPGTDFFEADNHALEFTGGLSLENISLSANYILNEGAGASGGDLYFEAGLTTGKVTLVAGAGTGWHTPNGNFNVCNLSISTTREIKITDIFNLPVKGSIILNPATEQFYVVVGINL